MYYLVHSLRTPGLMAICAQENLIIEKIIAITINAKEIIELIWQLLLQYY